MKKLGIVFLLLLNLFLSCSLEKKLIGMWRITDASLGNVNLQNEMKKLEKIVNKIKNDNGFAQFKGDKTGAMKIAGVEGNVFWFISADKKSIYTVNERKDTTKNEILTLNEKVLKIKSAGPLGDVIITFEKE